MKIKRKTQIKRNDLFKEIFLIFFLITFSLTYFYLDSSITGFSIFEITVADTVRPNITINVPLNNSNFSYTNITFNLLVGDDNANITNISILGNWTGSFIINSTNSSIALANNITIFTINITQGRGFYSWSATACDNSSNCNFTSNNTFFINRIPEITSINISSNGPTNKSNETILGQFNFLDSDNDVQTLNETRWYNNSVEITNFKNFTNVTFQNMTAGDNWIFSARVFDGENWSLWYNSSGHSIQNNTAPVFSGPIENRSWAEDTSLTNVYNLSKFFSDPENDNLNYSVIGNKVINVSISNSLVSMSQPKDWFGTEYIIFMANDSNLTRDSNNITLSVTSEEENPEITQQGGGTTRINTAIGIIAPAPKIIYLKDKIKVPITIKNTGSSTLQGIKLSTQTSDKDVKAILEKTQIKLLSSGSEETISLEILSDLQNKEAVEVIINAEVSSPYIKDYTKIFLNAVEFGASNKSVLIPRLQYVKDLFAKNAGCENLKSIVEKAETLLNSNKLNDAQYLINQAINGCTDLIVLDPKKIEVPKPKINEKIILSGELVLLTFLTTGLIIYFKKRKQNYF